jgi:hypothetical protein
MMNDQTDRIRSQATRYPVLLNLYRHERRSSGVYPLSGSNKERVVRAFGM